MNRNRSTTPMMEQYLGVKARYPDTLLLYRMGDFYETFYEDAVTLSRVLGIALTSRNAGDPDPIPLAGIPWHSAEPQIARLLRAGLKVAVCEQVGTAAEAKGLIQRKVVEVLSPGTTVADPLLERGRNNYLAALCGEPGKIGLAAADISTGAFLAGDLSEDEVEEELARLAPAEILTPVEWTNPRLDRWMGEHLGGAFRTRWDGWRFASARGENLLKEHFHVVTLAGYGFADTTQAIGAASALLEYAREQKQSSMDHIGGLALIQPSTALVLDEASLKGLEVVEPLTNVKNSTLLSVLDSTRTAAGGRRLRAVLVRPWRDPDPANERLDRVSSFVEDAAVRERIGSALAEISDIERIVARLHCVRATPRDLAGLRRTLLATPLIQGALTGIQAWTVLGPDLACPDLAADLDRALVDAPPVSVSDCGVFRDGYDPDLDRARDDARGGKRWMAEMEAREREASGIPNLKIGYNRVFGYYLDITKSQLSRVPDRYVRRQTLSTGERFVTPELKEHEERILKAEEEQVRLETALFNNLCVRIVSCTRILQRLASVLAEIDLVLSLSEAAVAGGYVRPKLARGGLLRIEDGRHPVVERSVGIGSFVPNDIDLDGEDRQIVILTGPNMAGKSTYLRQIGLIVLMAQIGSFVPARSATIGMADRIFTRVGAHDVIARGQSTFLVEMIETSNILRLATSESLVLMDEVGRGTSTYDGLSIAWAVAEALRGDPGKRPRTIFATHYHEMTRIAAAEDGKGYQNLNVLVREWGDQVIFLRRVVEGAADRSYGIEVARLAGVPEGVVRRAAEILRDLETRGAHVIEPRPGSKSGIETQRQQMSLFGSGEGDWLLAEIRNLDPDRLTPLDALQAIHDWIRRIDRGP
jgi:DNA mismatch repair protein MutS